MFYKFFHPSIYRPLETECFSNYACAEIFDRAMNELSETGKLNSQHIYELTSACGKKCDYVTKMYIDMAIQAKKKRE